MWYMPMQWAEIIACVIFLYKKIFGCFIKQSRLSCVRACMCSVLAIVSKFGGGVGFKNWPCYFFSQVVWLRRVELDAHSECIGRTNWKKSINNFGRLFHSWDQCYNTWNIFARNCDSLHIILIVCKCNYDPNLGFQEKKQILIAENSYHNIEPCLMGLFPLLYLSINDRKKFFNLRSLIITRTVNKGQKDDTSVKTKKYRKPILTNLMGAFIRARNSC
jgi:hypothetical protein